MREQVMNKEKVSKHNRAGPGPRQGVLGAALLALASFINTYHINILTRH
jgi:hypothetical protein